MSARTLAEIRQYREEIGVSRDYVLVAAMDRVLSGAAKAEDIAAVEHGMDQIDADIESIARRGGES